MNKKLIFTIFSFVILVVIAAVIFATSKIHTAPAEIKTERKVLFWYDPMYPNTKFDAPGTSPFMDMDLVPKYADEESVSKAVKIDPAQTQNLGLKIANASYGELVFSQTLPAVLNYNNHDIAVIQPRSSGFVEKAYPFVEGDSVKKDDALLEITVPEWVEAQSEYLFSKNRSVLERLRLMGMPSADIKTLEATLKLQTRFTIKAPISGVITSYELRSGMNFSKDNTIARIQGVSPIWVEAYIPEYLTSFIGKNSEFGVVVPSFPSKVFKLKNAKLLPSANAETRTLNLRGEIDNSDGILKPSMNAEVKLETKSERMLLIPSSAVIDDGAEQRVITVESDGAFVPKVVKILGEANGQSAVEGLRDGESVVKTGVFLIDSEANIAGALERMRRDAR